MRYSLLIPCVSLSVILAACQTPNQVNSVPLAQVQAQLPSDWIDVPPTDYRMAYLDSATRAGLVSFRKTLASERLTTAYVEKGVYSDASYNQWREINEECNKSYCASAVTIGKNLTPELAGTALSINEAYMNSVVTGDVNLRQVQDDWARFWLMNRPSMLSPYPIVNTGGRP